MTWINLFAVISLAHAAGVWSSRAVVSARDGNFGLCSSAALLTVCLVYIAYLQGAPHVQRQNGKEHPQE
jgi:hypothetical protein